MTDLAGRRKSAWGGRYPGNESRDHRGAKMIGLHQIDQFRATSSDGRRHEIRVFQETVRGADGVEKAVSKPYLVTGDGREVAPVSDTDGVYRVFGMGLLLRRTVSTAN